MKKYTAAIIGTGRIGFLLQKDKKREQPASHSSALNRNKRIRLIAGCDINKDRIIEWKNAYKKATVYTDYCKMMELEKPEIVVIAVDEIHHFNTAINVIKYKPKLIILEKPVAPDIKSALEIKNQANKFNVPICVNHERRFSLDYIFLKKLIDSNYIGEVHSINANLWSGMPVYYKASEKNGACLLIHDGIHLIDILYFLFGINLKNPVIDMITKDNNFITSLFLHYAYNKNRIVYFEFNGLKKYFGFEIEIRTSSKRIIIGNGYFKLFESKKSKFYSNFHSLMRNKLIQRPNKTKYFVNIIQNCVDFLDGKAELNSTIEQGIKNLKFIYEIIDKIKIRQKTYN